MQWSTCDVHMANRCYLLSYQIIIIDKLSRVAPIQVA